MCVCGCVRARAHVCVFLNCFSSNSLSSQRGLGNEREHRPRPHPPNSRFQNRNEHQITPGVCWRTFCLSSNLHGKEQHCDRSLDFCPVGPVASQHAQNELSTELGCSGPPTPGREVNGTKLHFSPDVGGNASSSQKIKPKIICRHCPLTAHCCSAFRDCCCTEGSCRACDPPVDWRL